MDHLDIFISKMCYKLKKSVISAAKAIFIVISFQALFLCFIR